MSTEEDIESKIGICKKCNNIFSKEKKICCCNVKTKVKNHKLYKVCNICKSFYKEKNPICFCLFNFKIPNYEAYNSYEKEKPNLCETCGDDFCKNLCSCVIDFIFSYEK